MIYTETKAYTAPALEQDTVQGKAFICTSSSASTEEFGEITDIEW